MTEKILLWRRKLVIAPVAEVRVESRREQLQIARVIDLDSVNFVVFQDIPTMACYTPLLDNIGENKHTNTKLAMTGNISRPSALDIVDAVTNFQARKSSIMQNQRISKKSACGWLQPRKNLS